MKCGRLERSDEGGEIVAHNPGHENNQVEVGTFPVIEQVIECGVLPDPNLISRSEEQIEQGFLLRLTVPANQSDSCHRKFSLSVYAFVSGDSYSRPYASKV